MTNFFGKFIRNISSTGKKTFRTRLITISGCFIVFFTTYALILPAITLSSDNQVLSCDYIVHQHTDDCYIEQPIYDDEGRQTGTEKVLVCGRADFVAHEHDDSCYDDGKLVCQLPEIKAHVHEKDCFKKEKVLACGLQETSGHTHSDSCYQETKDLVCSLTEHVHTDACYENVTEKGVEHLICGYDGGQVITPEVWSEPEYSEAVVDPETGEVLEEAQLTRDAELIQEAVVHYHDESCYEEDYETHQELICGMQEHTHDSSCYHTDQKLVCGLAEGASHVHSKSCYTEQQVLDCDYLELHTHTMACYESGPKGETPEEMGWARCTEDENGNQIVVGDYNHRICGKTEILVHQHTPDCFDLAAEETETDTILSSETETETDDVQETIDSETENETETGEVRLDGAAFETTVSVEGADYSLKISVSEDCGIPKEAVFKAVALAENASEYQDFSDKAQEAAAEENSDKESSDYQTLALFDLSISDAEGNVIQPQAPISVQVILDGQSAAAADEASDLVAVHFPGTSLSEDGAVTDAVTEEIISAQDAAAEVIGADVNNGNISFDAESLSVYAIVYTVDFHRIVEEKTVEFHLDGGYGIALSDLVRMLEIVVDDPLTEADEVESFISDIESVVCSDPSLLWVSKVQEDTTIGELIDANGIEIEYSAHLTEKDIAAANAYPVKAGDWALISLKPFTTEETLSIIKADGRVWTIIMTDAQNDLTENRGGFVRSLGAARLGSSANGTTVIDGTGMNLSPADILKIINGSTGTEQPDASDTTGLPKPESHKTLTPNYVDEEQTTKDGTYTLTLSVKPHSSLEEEEVRKKANVLFVMDRSSSMITYTVNDEKTSWYYGNTATATFRGDIRSGTGYEFYDSNGTRLYEGYNWAIGNWGTYTLHYNSATRNGVTYGIGPAYSGDLWVKSKTTRLKAEQDALDDIIGRLMEKNTTDVNDNVEISVISFSNMRTDAQPSPWDQKTEVGWTKGSNSNSVIDAIKDNRFASGTNWEEALQYAYKVMEEKKSVDGNNEDYYVVFLTDGAPTQDAHNHSGSVQIANENGYISARDDAWKLVHNLGVDFYNIYTFRGANDPIGYSIRLTNYAYTGQDGSATAITEGYEEYFSDARTIEQLNDIFQKVFFKVDVTSHANVKITDTLTTDAMATTVVPGQTGGYVYRVYDRNVDPNTPGAIPLYTATAQGGIGNPTVKFHVPGSSTTEYTGTPVDVGGKTYYAITTVEGKEYRIALADISTPAAGAKSENLTWDLSPIGTLMGGYTYTLSFVVWPDQEAYDYVAALNNRIDPTKYKWDTNAATYEDLTDTKGYAIGGVAQYPSIVRYPNGTYAVLTNTDQKLHYSVVETETIDGVPNGDPVITGPFYHDLETPNPMPLEDTKLRIQKVWNDSLDPSQLNDLINDHTKQFQAELVLKKGDNEYIDGIVIKPVTDGEGNVERTWPEQDVNGEVVEHYISTGLMVSKTAAQRSDLYDMIVNNSVYRQVTDGSEVYFILDTGYDYQFEEISEDPHFELAETIYHPMLVDGVLMNVSFSGNTITKMTSMEGDANTLTATNDLKGGLHIYKKLYDTDGNDITSLPNNKKFSITVTLMNPDGTPFAVNAADGGYRIYYGPNNPDKKEPVYDTDGTTILYYGRSDERYGISNGTFTAEIYAGDYIRVGNVDRGVSYVVTENNLPAGYELMEIVYADDTQYVTSNTSHEVDVKNKKTVEYDVSILKTGQDGNTPLPGAKFSLYGSDYYIEDPVTHTETVNPDAKTLQTNLVSGSNGKISLGKLDVDTYYLVEDDAPAGYIKLKEPVKIIVGLSTVAYEQNGNSLSDNGGGVIGNAAEGFTLTVTNDAGYALPATGGPGTNMIYFLGIAMIGFVGAGFVMLRRWTETQ